LENVDIFYSHLDYVMNILGYFMNIWHVVFSFGAFFPVLVSCTKKNLATLVEGAAIFGRSPKCRTTKC
jgi:hypothetical protein